MNFEPPSHDPRMVYLIRGGEHLGPFTRSDLRHYWAVGRISAGDVVWTEGMDNAMSLPDFLAKRPVRPGTPVLG